MGVPADTDEITQEWLTAALHEAGALLEALRPDIVVVTPSGQAKLTDVSDLLPLPVPPDAPIRATLYGMRRDDDNLRTLLLAPGFGTSAFRELTTNVAGGYPFAGPVSSGRPSNFHLSSPPSSTDTVSKPSDVSIHQNRVAHIGVPMLYSTTRLSLDTP